MRLAKRYFIVLALILALFIAAGFAINNFHQQTLTESKTAVEYEFQNRQRILTVGIASALQDEIDSLSEKMRILARNKTVISGEGEACSKVLREQIQLLDIPIANLSRVNTDKIFYCSVLANSVGIDGSKYDYINEIIDGSDHQAVYSRFLPFTNNQSQQDAVIAVHIPVFDDGKFVGTLGGAFFMSEMVQALSTATVNIPAGGWLVVMDDNGDVLYHPDNSLVGKNIYKQPFADLLSDNEDLEDLLDSALTIDNYSSTYRTVRDTENYGYVKLVDVGPKRHFSVLVTVPIDYVNDSLFQSSLYTRNATIAVIFLILLAVLSIITLFINWNRNISKEVSRATDSLAQKNTELDKIRTELNNTVNELRRRNDEVNKRVAEAERLNKIMVDRELKMIDLKKAQEKNDTEEQK